MEASSERARVRMSGERTLLSWIRTGLAMMGFGFVVARFGLFLRELALVRDDPVPDPTGVSLWIGTGLVILGVAVQLAAGFQHYRFLRRLDRGELMVPPRWSLALLTAGVLAGIGIGMTLYLLFLG